MPCNINTLDVETYYVRIFSYQLADFSNSYSYRLRIQTSSTPFGKTEYLEPILSASPSPLALYPNPAQETATALFYSDVAGTALVQINDLAGRMVHQQHMDVESGNNAISLDVHSLPKGFYVLSCVLNQQFYTHKLSIY